MTLRDLLAISTGNLRRMKLRTALTTSGVLIAIAAFVAMLSFGAGNQEYVEGEFNKLGLFTTLQVYPKSGPNSSDTSQSPQLDQAALARLAAIPGVNLVYPYDAFPVTVRLGDSVISSKGQALPAAALRTKLFSTLVAGRTFDNDSARLAVVSEELLKKAGISRPDSALGLKLILSVRVSSVDSGVAHVISGWGSPADRLRALSMDAFLGGQSTDRLIRSEAGAALRRFMEGLLRAQGTVTDTLTICGVRRVQRAARIHAEPLVVTLATGDRISRAGMSGSPTEMISRLSSGTLFRQENEGDGRYHPQVTIDFGPEVLYRTIRDSVEAQGFRTFSFAEQFEDLQRVFLTFDMAIGVIGLIALVTASLGIVNTMVMSITERRKEIGVLKSLGAYELDIRGLFLVEAGMIGLAGTSLGIFAGWVLTRIVSAIAKRYMAGQGLPEIELFALPAWLILLALGIGVGVSVAAGLYPAARAARVDPVEALRNE